MSIRRWLGLCEHKWVPYGTKIIELSYTKNSIKNVIGHIEPRECIKCGELRNFRI